MKTNSYTTRWYRAEIYLFLLSAIILPLGAAIDLYLLFKAPSLPVILLILITGIAIVAALAQEYKQKKGRLVKVFYVRPEAAAQVIENVLRQKDLPFRQANRPFNLITKAIYQLDNDVTIHLSIYRDRSYNQGTTIVLGPLSATNRPLVQSLQQKIDDAFVPKGLA